MGRYLMGRFRRINKQRLDISGQAWPEQTPNQTSAGVEETGRDTRYPGK